MAEKTLEGFCTNSDDRFIAPFRLLNACLRCGDRFIDALGTRLANLNKKEVAKELIQNVQAGVKGVLEANKAREKGDESYRYRVGNWRFGNGRSRNQSEGLLQYQEKLNSDELWQIAY